MNACQAVKEIDRLTPQPSDGGVAGEPVDHLADLVSRFSAALLSKLRAAEAKGRSGWGRTDWEGDCRRGLVRHLAKGDPRDVAAYLAFMWHHGWPLGLEYLALPPVPGNEGRETLENIARQLTSSEMDEDQQEHADWQGGYDTIVTVARSALSAFPRSKCGAP